MALATEGKGAAMTDGSEEWSVAFELVADAVVSREELLDTVDDLVDVLLEYAPAVSVGAASLEIRFDVSAPSPVVAAEEALAHVREATAKVGLGHFRVRRIDTVNPQALDAMLDEAVVPQLVGTAEVAGLLGVTKQRVSELSRSAHFPPPVTTLASGPVWAEPTILRFLDSWKRAPGRPSRTEAASMTACKEVMSMAGRTSARAARAASSVLRDGRTSKKSKTAAASALSQRAKTRRKKK